MFTLSNKPQKTKELTPIANSFDMENIAIFPLLRELFKYEKAFTTTPNELIQEVVKRVSPSHMAIGLECIRGEGAIIKAVTRLKREIALKVMRPSFNISAYPTSVKGYNLDEFQQRILSVKNFKARFEAGIEIQETLYREINSSKIEYFAVPEIREYRDKPCMSLEMEWVDGVNSLRWLKETNDIKYSIDKFCDVLDSVQFMHDLGYIHRDIKADNIMIGGKLKKKSKVYLLDFTTAKPLQSATRNLTVQGEGLGTPGYSDFDQLEGGNAGESDIRSDIYSLGILLFEFWHNKVIPRLKDEEYANPAKRSAYLSLLENKLPKPLKIIFNKATNTDKNKRYSSCNAFKSDIILVVESLVRSDFDEVSLKDFETELSQYEQDFARVKTELSTEFEEIIDTSFNIEDIEQYVKNKSYINQVKALMHMFIELGIKF